MNKDISYLYNTNPELYDIIANDRDFISQAKSIINYYGNCKNINIMELCAGPARHSIAFNHLGIDAYSIDISPSMKQYAVEKLGVDPNKYLLCDLSNHTKFNKNSNLPLINIFLLLRYSVGYFSKAQLLNLIDLCKSIAQQNSILIIELHNLEAIRADLKNCDIRVRKIELSDKRISCIWPNKNPLWQSNAWTITMEVLIQEESLKNNTFTNHLFYSTENIHSIQDIEFIAEIKGLKVIHLNEYMSQQFGNSNLIGILF